ncbi:hypothetical protein NC652_014829 [Populus alba x Populus x berolinensis]|nr:hypothetical protein NC652_014829 [Populus alba x Populus x berolinensis]
MSLSPFTPDPSSQLNILRHDCNPFSMNGTQICVLKETHKISLSCFLKSRNGTALEPEISLKILSNFSHKPLEGELADQKLSALLVLPDFSQSNSSWPETVGFLHASGGWGRLPGSLSCQLLARGLASGGFSCSLLGTGHC